MSKARWQPVIMVLDRRLECDCGALAVFVNGEVAEDENDCLNDVGVYCQDCWQKELEDK